MTQRARLVLLILLSIFITSLKFPQVFAGYFSTSPTSANLNTGASTTFTLTLNTAGKQITGTDLILSYNPSVIQITQATPNASLFDLSHAFIDSTQGRLRISATMTSVEKSFNGSGTLATITVQALAGGTANLSFVCSPGSTTDSNMSEYSTGNDVINCSLLQGASITISGPPPSPTPTPVPSPTPTPPPSPTPTPPPSTSPTPSPTPSGTPLPSYLQTINFSTRFAGVTTDIGPILTNVQLGVMGSTTPTIEQTLPFTFSSGNYIVSLNNLNTHSLSTSNKYWVSLKGQKHLRRVVRDLDLANISNLDFTGLTQLVGDLPPQNGFINTNDINLILAQVQRTTATVDQLHQTDLNYDGAVNSIDMSLILQSLSTRPDELN